MRDVGLKRYRFDMTDEESRWDDIQCLLSDIKEAAGQAKSAEERILRYFENNFRDVQTGANLKYRPLTTNQIRTMTESHWCHFGSHSHRHEILTNLDDRELKENLAESKTFLESVLGEPICHISYPDGAADARVLARCGEAGYKYGYLAAGGCVGPHTDPLMIPRIGVGGYDSLRSLYTKINGALLDAILSRLNG
jgi:peptidoglycan/xylan/chitin deacetylase (PgdA/CDA1 family)